MTDLNNGPEIDQTHPNLYRTYFLYGLLSIALGLNFLILNPTFDPLDIPKQVPGAVFMVLGIAVLTFLRVYRSATLLRVMLASTVAVMFFWTGALVFDFIRLGQTSLQLPITYLGLASLAVPLTIEPSTNPVTETDESDDGHE